MDKLTEEEAGIIAVVRLNKLEPKLEVRKEWRLWRVRIVYHWRSSENLWGRFGGGWNWKIGAQAGGRSLIVDLLVFSLRFEVLK